MFKLFKKSVLALLFIIPFMFSSQKAEATHVMGADITYKCLDNLKFEFTITYYRWCAGVSFSTPSTWIECSGSGTSINVTPSLSSIKEITPVCASAGGECVPQNTRVIGAEGIEQHVYKVVIDFNVIPYSSLVNCGKVRLRTGQCCRNSNINTGAANQRFFTFAELDLAKAPCNSSPALTSEPIAILCCNQPFFFNNGALDTANFDSLSYSWANPKGAGLSNLSYSGTNYAYNHPFQAYYPSGSVIPPVPGANPPIGIYLDELTGDIILTPTRCDEVTVAVIEVKEWRKDSLGVYQEIGTTRRDMQFITKTCPDNNPPIVNGPYSYDVCEGGTLCFNVTTTDPVFTPPPPASPPPPDSVKISWNRAISGATFTVINPTSLLQTGRFCWTPGPGTASDLPYSFTVTARDDACPLNAVSVRAFRVRVKHRAEADRLRDTLPCGVYAIESDPSDGFRGTPGYEWNILDSNQNIVFDKDIAKFYSTGNFLSVKKQDTILFREGGTYYIQHTIKNPPLNCPTTYIDTLVVPPLLKADLSIGPDTFVCAGTDITFNPYLSNTTPPITYQWSTMGVTNDGKFLNNVTSNPADDKDTFTLSIPNVQYDTAVSILITDGSGCTSEDTVQVFLKANPLAVLPPDPRICSYDSVTIIPNLDTAYWVDPIMGDTLVQGDTLFKEWFYNGVWTPFSLDDSVTIHQAGAYVIRVYDSLNCADTDTLFLLVNDTVIADAGPDQILCFDDPLIITAGGLDTVGNGKSGLYRWHDITPPGSSVIGTNNTYTYSASVDKDYRLELTVNQGGVECYDDDSVSYLVNPLPIVELGPDQVVCCDAGNILLNFSLITPAGAPPTGGWSCPQYPNTVTNNVFSTDSACGLIPDGARSIDITVVYQYQNPTTFCINSDSITITVNGLPTLVLQDRQYCQDIGAIDLSDDLVLSPVNTNAGFPSWRCLDSNSAVNRFTADMLENRGSQFAADYWLNLDEANYTIINPDKDTVVLEFTYVTPQGCTGRDTVSIYIWRVPKITFSSNRELCFDEGEVSLNTITGINLTDGIWTIYDSTGFEASGNLGGLSGDTINTLASIDDNASHTWLIRYDHIATGCPARNDTLLTIHPLPEINLTALSPNQRCETAANQLLGANPSGGTWTSEDPTALVGGNTWSPSNASVFGQFTKFYYNYTDPTTGCSNLDSLETQVDPQATIDPIPDTTFCRTQGVMVENIQRFVTGQNTSGLSWLEFSPRVTLGDVASGNITMNLQNNQPDTFTIITNAAGLASCDAVDGSFTIIVNPIPDASIINSNPNGCNPVTSDFSIDITNSVDSATSSYNWTLGDASNTTASTTTTSTTYDVDGTANISVVLTSPAGCDTTLTSTVDVYPIPVAGFVPNPDNFTTAALPRFIFNNTSTVDPILGANIVQYEWDFGDLNDDQDVSDEESPSFFYPTDTNSYVVNLRVTTNHGCSDNFSYPVVVGPDLIVFVPNAFTPNEAGPDQNEGFRSFISGEKAMELVIFNRWGEIMFKTTDKNEKWNGIYKGVEAQQDVYAYSLKVIALDDKEYEYTGTITIIR